MFGKKLLPSIQGALETFNNCALKSHMESLIMIGDIEVGKFISFNRIGNNISGNKNSSSIKICAEKFFMKSKNTFNAFNEAKLFLENIMTNPIGCERKSQDRGIIYGDQKIASGYIKAMVKNNGDKNSADVLKLIDRSIERRRKTELIYLGMKPLGGFDYNNLSYEDNTDRIYKFLNILESFERKNGKIQTYTQIESLVKIAEKQITKIEINKKENNKKGNNKEGNNKEENNKKENNKKENNKKENNKKENNKKENNKKENNKKENNKKENNKKENPKDSGGMSM